MHNNAILAITIQGGQPPVLVVGEDVVKNGDQGTMNRLKVTDGRVRTGRSTSTWDRAGYPWKTNAG
jgi:hypothetical protein